MSPALHGLMLALYAAGLAVVVLASMAALVLRGVLNRLHLLTPVTSVGGPLIGLALAIRDGWSLTTGEIGLTVALLALSGPVLEAATGRVTAQRQGITKQESPR